MTIAFLGSEEKTPRKTAENTVKHRDGGVGSVVANHRSAAESSVVVTTLPITTDVARSMVCVCVCVCVCVEHMGELWKKRLNWSRCVLGADSCELKKHCVRWGRDLWCIQKKDHSVINICMTAQLQCSRLINVTLYCPSPRKSAFPYNVAICQNYLTTCLHFAWVSVSSLFLKR